MKKFFGLKMALAVLAAGAFVSCTDSEAGDIYIPTPGGGGGSPTVNVVYPAAQYVVSGVVTDADNGAALQGVDVSGAISATTDANGFFTSGDKDAPMNGVVTFAKDGYIPVNRTLVMIQASTGVVSESMNVVMSSGTPVPAGRVVDVTDPAADTTKAVKVPAAKLADLVNDSDEDKVVMVDVADLGLPYGAIVAPTKGEFEDAVKAFVEYYWGNDPYVGYGKLLADQLALIIPAHAKVTELEIIPLVREVMYILENAESPEAALTQLLEVIDQYRTNPTFSPIDQHDTHDGHNGQNVGGGSSDAA